MVRAAGHRLGASSPFLDRETADGETAATDLLSRMLAVGALVSAVLALAGWFAPQTALAGGRGANIAQTIDTYADQGGHPSDLEAAGAIVAAQLVKDKKKKHRKPTVSIEPEGGAPPFHPFTATGATPERALEDALKRLDLDPAYVSWEVLEQGGNGRPARVRVNKLQQDGHMVAPSAPDSILTSTLFTVLVQVPLDEGDSAPGSVSVNLSVPSALFNRSLTCYRDALTLPDVARYRRPPLFAPAW